MLTQPAGLSDVDLKEVVGEAWGLSMASLVYRPVGFGSHHWAATDTHGLRHFVTVDELSSESRIGDEVSALGIRLRPALTAATDLHAVGCGFVVAPVATTADHPFVQFGNYVVALYPFVAGRSFSFEDVLDGAELERILEMVVALHGVPMAAIRPPAMDRFVVPGLDQLEQSLDGDVEEGANGPHAGVASRLLIDHEAQIRRLMARYRALVARYRSDPGPVAVTHGEVHPGNVMVTSEGWVMVDWDTALVAPPERDVWRLAQGDGSVLQAYADATGSTLKAWLVDLYGLRWDLAEIASFAADFRRPHEDTEDSRKALFLLGSVVDRLPASSSSRRPAAP